MKRLLVLLALANVLACGDDDGSSPSARDEDAGPRDGGNPVRDMDAAVSVARISNPGAACSSDDACQGPQATCAEATLQNVPFPGGSCTASCLSADQCGPQGDCPFGELVAALGVGHSALGGLTAGQCLQRCGELGQRSTCRDGYVCSNFASTNPLAVALPAWERPVCLPIAQPLDGGARDAATDASSADASTQLLDATL